ncbi:MAG TPA: 4-hydroxybenzoyl-CoA thioesterase [Cyanobacteria bacterium UBA11149]|nr:4-hydroxybenzoyl-CoA thioesterase [Cyanobacteria bacterium UBA11367]HBE57657.1 4-hydroxybenzoyl-CoA thioesterase [Cyanobacteria bacterium UBA11366]HBK66004.1 4-hydroxybenzoyl-CoA thioesterase [Cyanobacteria bacterium UBA11166]HBR74724.1 4-hydroxybenzoyl-CoA thioesterase [Cyanobacteria bacterium UBA11159]HBS68394.1 4-hydroxybenzoyl-CoA thioesterase [Cyanobacteria bacterium UBA11153]HBW90896.1 4-hydroxybenzoyl-CoA thioesterase [Cyanobacteria bacterium UBA11149]HCA96746.1 4-hydroxybenzoyl-CoA
MKAYEYHHIVSFEETNLVGNVYFANYILWQGKCREMFLRDYVPEIIKELSEGLALVTVKVSCEYFYELYAFNKLTIRMRLESLSQNRVTMLFEYWRITEEGEELVAKGEQQTASMGREGEKTVPTPMPEGLREALRLYEAK